MGPSSGRLPTLPAVGTKNSWGWCASSSAYEASNQRALAGDIRVQPVIRDGDHVAMAAVQRRKNLAILWTKRRRFAQYPNDARFRARILVHAVQAQIGLASESRDR